MASRNSLTPPNSPPGSLLSDSLDHIDIPYDLDALAQSLVQSNDGQPSRDLSSALSPATPGHIDMPSNFDAAAQSDIRLPPVILPAILDHIDIPYDIDPSSPSESEEPSHNPPSAALPAITDHIDIPRNLEIAAQTDSAQRSGRHPSTILPAVTNHEEQHPFGILNSIHFRLRIGRDISSANPNALPPAPPARIVQRNDFKGTPPNGDPNARLTATTITTTTTTTYYPFKGVTWEDQVSDNLLGDAMKPTFPPKLEGVVEARQKSEAKTTEDLAGLGAELEAAVLAKREYNEKFGAFRTRWSEVQFALADKAEEMRGRVDAAKLRPLIGAIGVMFAMGKAVDLAAFPGSSFGEFDERACSPQGYLSSLFPELTHRPLAGPVDPWAQAMEVLAPLPSLQWDFSLGGIMAGEKREGLRALWAAAAAGQWEAVDEKTKGALAVAEELLRRA
ncbi:hypothetical protein J7T55_014550 [Diaporthe amygdali]|uniref:uncharacterized protein n=1 Tax=Phomopsis amygdali TaxID=1214568 RepID=UPI0022FF1290|nr:uncharacterized protein J7T55_014550 [Diaporthe amygdali]KAJ0118097.1 hypothetical protein J7T55_014550 [Diaporthe amygdali]